MRPTGYRAAVQPLVIIGAGGHGREVLDVVEAVNDVSARYDVLGVVADHADVDLLARRGTTLLGSPDHLVEGALAELVPADAMVVVAVGDPGTRTTLAGRLEGAGWAVAPALVHPSATVGGDVRLGDGAVLAAGARVTTNVTIGRHVQLNVGAVVSHDSVIGDHATLSPGVLVNGSVRVGEGAFLGSGVIVTPGRTIGRWAVVGAGAVVVHDVPEGVTATGVPARWT
jgi:sugar O-acyltransferase (sialic acid O-acetyltransferase NeuD family)